MNAETFNLTLEDAEFVVHELPQGDLFTQELWRWVEEQRAKREREEALAAARWERIAPAWNRMLWSAVGVKFEEEPAS